MSKKIFVLVTFLIMCVSANVYASAETLEKIITENGEIELSGTVDKTHQGKQASLIVLNDGYEEKDFYDSESPTEMTAAYKECTIDTDGGYKFCFVPKNKTGDGNVTGDYYAIISLDGTQIRQTLRVALKSDNDAAVKSVKDKIKEVTEGADETQLAEVGKVIKDNASDLLIKTDETYNKGTESEILKILVDYCKDNSAEVEKMDGYGLSSLITKAATISALNNAAVSFDYNMLVDVGASDDVLKYFGYDFMNTSAAHEMAYGIINRTKITSLKEFDERLDEATVLSMVRFADGYGYIKDCLSDFSDASGIGADLISDSACRAVTGKSYSSYQALKSALSEAKPNQENSDKETGGGSTGGGSTGGGSGTISVPPAPNTKPEPVSGRTDGADANTFFNDLSGLEWAEDAITSLAQKGVINGREEGVFAPNENVLREEFIKIIMSACGFADIKGDINFSDVKEDEWYYNYIKNAYLCGIVQGIGEDTFGVGDKITRQDAAVMIMNAAKAMSVELPGTEDADFADESDIADYAKTAVHTLRGANIINGKDNNIFDPRGNATRAEAAKMIFEFLKVTEGNV